MTARERYVLLGALIAAWVAIQLGLLAGYGIRGGGDTGRYYSAARQILSGALPSGKAASYLGYDAFVAVFLALGLGSKWIAAVQTLIALAVLPLVYRIGVLLYDERVGFTALALFALYPDISYWHTTVLTESLYTSMVVASIFLMVSAASPGRVLGAVIVFCFTCAIRPHGVGFAAAGLLFLACRLAAARRYGLLALIGLAVAVAAPLAWSVLGLMTGHEDLLRHYAQGTVIWGYSPADLPPGPGPAGAAGHPLAAIVSYIAGEPVRFLTLAAHKIGFFLVHARPYFAGYHNLLSLGVLLPAYAFAAIALARVRAAGCGTVLLACTFAAQAAIVALTFADWDGRHLIPVLSVVFLLASAGLWGVVDRFRTRGRG